MAETPIDSVYVSYAWQAEDETRLVEGENRVLRGGSWINNGRNCRSANRSRPEPDNRNNSIDFRLALGQASPGLAGGGERPAEQTRGTRGGEAGSGEESGVPG
jgi:hypothetical protein